MEDVHLTTWTQLPTNGGVPVTFIGGNTATPYFIAPKISASCY
jgi:hypothetical protein